MTIDEKMAELADLEKEIIAKDAEVKNLKRKFDSLTHAICGIPEGNPVSVMDFMTAIIKLRKEEDTVIE